MPLKALARREHDGWMYGLSAAQNPELETSTGLSECSRGRAGFGALCATAAHRSPRQNNADESTICARVLFEVIR